MSRRREKCKQYDHYKRYDSKKRKCCKKPCGKFQSPENVTFTMINATDNGTEGKVFWVRNCDTVTVWFNLSISGTDPPVLPFVPLKVQINIPGLPVSKVVTLGGDFNYGQRKFIIGLSNDRLIDYGTEVIEGTNNVTIDFGNSFLGSQQFSVGVDNFVTFPIEDPYKSH